MTSRPWTALFRIGTAIAAVAAASVLAVRLGNGVDTDLYSLADLRNGGIVRDLASRTAGQGRILLEGGDLDAMAKVADGIRTRFGSPKAEIRATLRLLAEHRAGLLSRSTRELLLAGDFRVVADDAVARLFGLVPPLVSVKEDPFMLLTGYVQGLQSRQAAGWTLRAGNLVREKSDGTCQMLLVLDLSAVPRNILAEFLSDAEASQTRSRDVVIWCGGPPFHAASATASATREINVLSLLSLLCVVAIGWRLFRSPGFMPGLILAIGAAFLVAAAALFAAYPRPHVLTFVFGTSLIGLGVDYAYHARAAGDVRRVRRPLALALATTLACFAPLLFADVPVLRQMALFLGAGLAMAFAWVNAWTRTCPTPEPSEGLHAAWAPPRWFAAIVLVGAALGIVRLRFTSAPEAFYMPSAYLAASERRLAECNPSGDGRFVLVRGATVQEALEREESMDLPGLSSIVPSLARQRENAALVARLYQREGTGYSSRTGVPVNAPPAAGDDSLLDPDSLDDPVLSPLVHAMRVADGTIFPCPPGFSASADFIEILDPRQMLQDMFARFTSSTCRLLSVSLLALVLLLALLFGKKFLSYAVPLVASLAATAGAMGWAGVPVTFFTSLCFFALAGLGLDYIIFHKCSPAPVTRRTVFASFLTSLAGLGMLAFTQFVVTRAMGVVFAFGLLFAWLAGAASAVPARRARTDNVPWFLQREQSAGRLRLLFLWYSYALFGKTFLKLLCIPVVAFIYPFARPAKDALREFYSVIGLRASRVALFRHILGFAWAMADKTDASTLRRNLPKMSVRDDDGARAFGRLMEAKAGVFVISSHLGSIEVLSALAPADAPHVHAFQQMGHDAVFTRLFAEHLDGSRLTLHPVEEIGMETAAEMQDAIARGEMVIMAGDRVSAGSSRTLAHDFLGVQCKWPKGVFVFAKLMEAPIFFVTCVRTGWNAYEAHFAECRSSASGGINGILDQYVRFLESETRAHPAQWHNFHSLANASLEHARRT